MTKRYYRELKTIGVTWSGPQHLVIDRKGIAECPNCIIAECYDESDAMRIVDALNAVDQLTKAVWGTEGCPNWLEAQR